MSLDAFFNPPKSDNRTALETFFDTTAASPVQGAASFAPGWDISCTVTDTATSSASGAKGAAVKPWQERMREAGKDTRHGTQECSLYKDAEIADWRALADRAPAVQPVAAEQALQQIQHKLKVMLASATALGEGEWIEGYQIKTGALHGILGIMAGAGYAVTIPLPERVVAEFQKTMRAEVIPEVAGVLQERADAARATEHLPLSATPAPEQEAAPTQKGGEA